MGYDPNQPRVPAGNPDGGQWTKYQSPFDSEAQYREFRKAQYELHRKSELEKKSEEIYPGLKEKETYVDHGPKGWTAGKHDITRVDKNVLLDLKTLVDELRVDLVRTRRNSIHGEDYIDALKESLAGGWDFDEGTITVFVEHDGSITINEGTHRIMLSLELGYDRIPAEVRYFGMSDEKFLLEYLPNTAEEAIANVAREAAGLGR